MEVSFEKWHGCRNDFILIPLPKTQGSVVIDAIRRQAVRLCARTGAGIAADGIIVIRPAEDEKKPYRLDIFNSDGSIAQHCGNGVRCAAGLLFQQIAKTQGPYSDPVEFLELTVGTSTVICRQAGNTKHPLIAVEMGVPKLDEAVAWHGKAVSDGQRVSKDLLGAGTIREIHTADLGNPHLILFADDRAALGKITQVGPALQHSPLEGGINVHIVVPKTDPHAGLAIMIEGESPAEVYEAVSWERGAGLTQACGTGASTIGAAVLSEGFADRERWLGIDMPGGRLFVKQTEEGGMAYLAGPAEYVFRGSVEI